MPPKIRQLQPPKLPAIASIPKSTLPLVRRGLRPKVIDLAAQAAQDNPVPPGLVATIPEWLVYEFLQKRGIMFDFQCIAGHHKILTADLRWVSVKDLTPGDLLLNASENQDAAGKRYLRKWETGAVIYNTPEQCEVMDVCLSDGTVITTTPEHPWLIRYDPTRRYHGAETSYNWCMTKDLRVGYFIPRFLDTWETETSWDAGWLAGFFDGEGSVVHSHAGGGTGDTLMLTLAQNPGVALDKTIAIIQRLGFPLSIYDYRDRFKRSYDDGKRQLIQLRIAGGRKEILRFLGSIRPVRLLLKLDLSRLGQLSYGKNVRVEAVTPTGIQTIYRLGVSNKTYIAEGFLMHNSSQLGGRLELGGAVADFVLYEMRMIWRVQGEAWHIGDPSKEASDLIQKMRLTDEGYTVIDLYTNDILQYRNKVCSDALRGIEWRKPILAGIR